jgi:signal transduction histidine kinase
LYLILGHQVLELRILMREILRYVSRNRVLDNVRFVIVCSAALCLLLVASQPIQSSGAEIRLAAYGLLIAALLQPRTVRLLTSWLDPRLFHTAHAEETLLYALSRPSYYRDTLQLAQSVASKLSDALQLSRASVVLKQEAVYAVAVDLPAPGGQVELSTTDSVVRSICREGRIAHVYLDDPRSWVQKLSSHEQAFLRTLETRVLLPLAKADQLFGFVSLGAKVADQAFSSSELDLLAIAGVQISLEVENCTLLADLKDEILRSERRNAEREAANQANQAKSGFLATMSHELRTPLNAIIGYSEMLYESAEEIGAKEMISDLKRIHSAGKHLLGLINSVLDFSKIEAGKMDLHPETVSVTQIVQDVVSIAKPLMSRNKNTFECHVSPDIGSIVTDVMKLRQSIVNLLSNAAKFCDQGVVSLSVQRITQAGSDRIVFEVRDTGIGMTPEQTAKLFQPFVQANSEISKKFGGTGLGLALSRRFCEMMRGDITVTSHQGVGTTFRIQLPADVSKPDIPEKVADHARNGVGLCTPGCSSATR